MENHRVIKDTATMTDSEEEIVPHNHAGDDDSDGEDERVGRHGKEKRKEKEQGQDARAQSFIQSVSEKVRVDREGISQNGLDFGVLDKGWPKEFDWDVEKKRFDDKVKGRLTAERKKGVPTECVILHYVKFGPR
ncbi:hypothetical protein A4X13_0g7111 [Tilletia indica]|uniref:Uncharacterized protein n=1 Tax=Tilletia indica TaxID=43049 RepID=A0A177TEQ6_9BASI|nr:hypothetical protein A4X13_0g7111 [Tilletia indica]